jgi:hippurate hydrolase
MRAKKSVSACLALAAAILFAPASAEELPRGYSNAEIAAYLDAHYAHLDAVYKDIHAHPELGFAERRTAALLAKEMRALGFQVTEGVGRTGVVAIYRNGEGPTVMVRTELDALPLREETGLPYASQVQTEWNGRSTYVMHACGHDAHMAAWLGTAGALVAEQSRWNGTLMIVAQPAEEGGGGAQAMIDDGLFTRFAKPDYAFALHTGPAAAGTVQYRSGVLTSNADAVSITFKGRGGHGSDPSATIDPVLIASRFVVDLQGVVSREKDPQAPGVVTIGAIEGGSAGNIIPDQVTVRGTIRSFDPATRTKLKEGTARVALASAAMAGAPAPQIDIGGTPYDAVINDPALTGEVGALFKTVFGDNASELSRPGTPSEDYSAFVNAGVPKSLFFTIGAIDPAKIAAAQSGGPPVPVNHSPRFAPMPEPSIRTGVKAMTLAVLYALSRDGGAAPS